MIQDMHNHTKFSYDGVNTPEELIENAVRNGVELIGITDHQFTIGADLWNYYEKIRECGEKYKDKITVLCGLEIGTRPAPDDLLAKGCSKLDYCLFECLDSPAGMDLYEFLEWRKLFDIKVGLAHTDIFALSKRYGVDMLEVMKRESIFWELNTSGNYSYYYDFLTNSEKRKCVYESGVLLSAGSDTHWTGDFSAEKLQRANSLIEGRSAF